ncbi:MAG: MarR family EPS-associated transcriptional regulator [Candidatus Omnitrophica bacterium]|nr:MarR family EPS-associated transcriptional regulator [Candidatus Omnitrophota bacterium]
MEKIDKHTLKEDIFNVLRLLSSGDNLTQRDVSSYLDISLGKTNYLLKSLIKKNLIKAMNFSKNPGKLGKVRYILTKKGLEEKVHLMYHFLKKKEIEYNHIRNEWVELQDQLKNNGEKTEVNLENKNELFYQVKGEKSGAK